MEVLRWSRLVLLVRCGLGFQVASPGLASRRASPLTMALDGFMLTRRLTKLLHARLICAKSRMSVLRLES